MEKRNSFRGKSASGSSPRGNRSGGRAENGHRTSNDRREGRASNNGDSTRRSSAPAWREKKDDSGKRPFDGARDAQPKFLKKSPKGSSWKGLRDRPAKPEGEVRGERFDAASSSRERRPFSTGRDEKKEFGRHKSEMPARGNAVPLVPSAAHGMAVGIRGRKKAVATTIRASSAEKMMAVSTLAAGLKKNRYKR